MSLWCSEYGMGVWAAMPMRATHMGLTCVDRSASTTDTAECSLPSEKYPSWPASLRLGVSRGRRRDGAGEKTWRVLLCVLQYRRKRRRCREGEYVQCGGLWIDISLLPYPLLYSGRHNYGSYQVNVKLIVREIQLQQLNNRDAAIDHGGYHRKPMLNNTYLLAVI